MVFRSWLTALPEMENTQDYRGNILMSVPHSVLELLCQDKGLWQRYILACLLLVRNEYLSRESRKHTSKLPRLMPKWECTKRLEVEKSVVAIDSKLYRTSLDPSVLTKNPAGRVQSGGKSREERADDSFLPGLPDHLALFCLGWSSRSDFPALACLNRKFNELIRSGYLYEARKKLEKVEHWVYLSCNMRPWISFDPSRMLWRELPQVPCDECFRFSDKESLAVGMQLLVFGREAPSFAIWMYSILGGEWTRAPAMNRPRCLFGSGSSGDIAIVAGGCDNNQVLKCAELYNSVAGTWEMLPDMSVPRKHSSGFFMDGEFYVIGGVSDEMKPFTCGEVYNLDTKSWRTIQDMYPGGSTVHQSPPLVAVVNNELYAADQSLNVVKKYNKESKTWHVVKQLPVRADFSNGWGLAFKSCGDRLLVIAGYRSVRGEVIVLHSWRPGEGSNGEAWEVLSVKENYGIFICNCAIMGC